MTFLDFIIFAHMSVSGFQYDPWCCSDKDCAMIPIGDVEEVQGGYKWETEYFAYSDIRIRQSPDGEYHGCKIVEEYYNYGAPIQYRCLYVPPKAF